MATLERVMQMKQQGMLEPQIITALRQEGLNPKEINDALTQSKIKSELSQQPPEQFSGQGMMPSIVQKEQESQDDEYPEYNPEEYKPEASTYPQYDTSLAQPSPQGYYQEYEAPQQQTDVEAINEIAEQIVDEKVDEIKKQISSFKDFAGEVENEIERVNKRLEKLETNFGQLQMAVIKKIGEYGENIKNIADEMHQTQDSFSKILNPLTDNIRELQKITSMQQPKKQKQENEKPASQEKKPMEPGFENYLR